MISAGEVWRQLRSGPGIVDNVCNFIIRPPRSDYELEDLGPEVFRVGDDGTRRYDRTDFELENMRGMKMQCSWFRPMVETAGERRERRPCVVYCHANCGSRYDGLEALFLLEKGFTLFTFDFCGSGMSDGEYISLGFYERQDLAVVVEFLHSKTMEVDGVGLWGRSMGAVTSIMYGAKDPGIRCVVCDSPFASLHILIHDLVTQHGGRAGQLIPSAVVNMIVNGIRKRIATRAAFDINDLDTIKYAAQCTVPALLFHGDADDFVSPQQSMRVQRVFQGPCLHELTPGGHNDERDADMQNLIATFFQLYMVEKPTGQREARLARQAQQRLLQEGEDVALKAAMALSLAESAPQPPSTAGRHTPVLDRPRVESASAPKLAPATLAHPTPGSPASLAHGTAVMTGTVMPPASLPTPAPCNAEPIAEASHRTPAFSQSEEERPRMRAVAPSVRPASGSGSAEKGPAELGTGQAGPISFTKPRMKPATEGEAHQHPETEAAAPPPLASASSSWRSLCATATADHMRPPSSGERN